MILWKCCTQYASKFGKPSSGHRTGKGQFSLQSQKGNAKECSNYHTIALISHTSKVMLKILQARTEGLNGTELNCSWGSQGKNTEVVCHSLFQWTTFCQNSPPWPVHLVWSCMEWFIISLNYTRLWSMWSILANFLLLWFSFCLSSDGWGWETCGNFLMWGTACGENWVLLCWAGRCSLNLQPNCLLMGVAVPPPSSLAWDGPVLEPAVSMVGWQALWQG